MEGGVRPPRHPRHRPRRNNPFEPDEGEIVVAPDDWDAWNDDMDHRMNNLMNLLHRLETRANLYINNGQRIPRDVADGINQTTQELYDEYEDIIENPNNPRADEYRDLGNNIDQLVEQHLEGGARDPMRMGRDIYAVYSGYNNPMNQPTAPTSLNNPMEWAKYNEDMHRFRTIQQDRRDDMQDAWNMRHGDSEYSKMLLRGRGFVHPVNPKSLPFF
jgi:hypothetical protein